MTDTQPAPALPRPQRALRLWPAVLLICVQFAFMFGPGLLVELQAEPASNETPVEQTLIDNPQNILFGKLLGPAGAALLLAAWWLLFSRAGWKARLLGLIVFVGCGWAGMQGREETKSQPPPPSRLARSTG